MSILHDKIKKYNVVVLGVYKAYFDRTANVSPLAVDDYCFVLNPKADTQATIIPFRVFNWVGPYKVAEVLPNNYIIRRIGTNFTLILHRIRLKKFNPVVPIPDVISAPSDWKRDDQITVTQDDLYAITWETNFGDAPFDNVNSDDQSPGRLVTNGEAPNNDVSSITLPPPTSTEMESEAVTTQDEGNSPPNQEVSNGNDPGEVTNSEPDSEGTDTESTVTYNPRSGPYKLRPNPNPNYSYLYRY